MSNPYRRAQMIKSAQRMYVNEGEGGLGEAAENAVSLGQRYGLQAAGGVGVGLGVNKILKDSKFGKTELGAIYDGKKYMKPTSKILGVAAGLYAAKKLNDIIRKKNRRER